MKSILPLLLALPATARAACECGYTSSNEQGDRVLFTDLTETDFREVDDLRENGDWAAQVHNKTAEAARGEYGVSYEEENVETQDPGMNLVVRSEIEDGMVPVAEVASIRQDMFYGSFRVAMKLSDVSGTCAAFFWYLNDTQELDMEFLSDEFNDTSKTYPVNLVLQSRESASSGFDASSTPNFVKANLTFNPTTDFHEYRIDFLPGRVAFLADGETLAEMTGDAVPDSAGHLMLSHWSNGNEKWSGGPPQKDAVLEVSYVKAYFNSSDEARTQAFDERCTPDARAADDAVCAVPDVTPADRDAMDFFFYKEDDMTPGQIVSGRASRPGIELSVLGLAALGFFAGVL